MIPILIDTDPGQDIDDLLAIHFALLRPELDIRAITTVTWPSAGRARLVKRLLRHLGRDDIPVAAGMQAPLRPLPADEAARLRDPAVAMNHACFAEPAEPADEAGGDAVDLILGSLRESPTPLTLCCIAPLTNVACALIREPDIVSRIGRIILMGGEIALDRAEHNIAHDPVASAIVLGCGAPISMGTWDVTRRLVLDDADCRRFADGPLPLHRALADAIAAWHPAQSWKPGPVMYDLFPLVEAFAPGIYELREMAIEVPCAGEHCGRTLARPGSGVRVSTGVDLARLRGLYVSTVFGGKG